MSKDPSARGARGPAGPAEVGGAIATISEKMKGPRGCAWDGDGTVYVADETGNKATARMARLFTRLLIQRRYKKRPYT